MKEKDKKLYDGWLVSNNFWKRSVAVWAYGLVIPGILLLIFILLALI